MSAINNIMRARCALYTQVKKAGVSYKQVKVSARFDESEGRVFVTASDQADNRVAAYGFPLNPQAWSKSFQRWVERVCLGSIVTGLRGR